MLRQYAEGPAVQSQVVARHVPCGCGAVEGTGGRHLAIGRRARHLRLQVGLLSLLQRFDVYVGHFLTVHKYRRSLNPNVAVAALQIIECQANFPFCPGLHLADRLCDNERTEVEALGIYHKLAVYSLVMQIAAYV